MNNGNTLGTCLRCLDPLMSYSGQESVSSVPVTYDVFRGKICSSHRPRPLRILFSLMHTSRSNKSGAPGDVYVFAQTTDGFLWLGTMQGLCRRSSIHCSDAGGLPFLRACMLVCCRS